MGIFHGYVSLPEGSWPRSLYPTSDSQAKMKMWRPLAMVAKASTRSKLLGVIDELVSNGRPLLKEPFFGGGNPCVFIIALTSIMSVISS